MKRDKNIRHSVRGRGFSLIEVMLAVLIVGIAIVAMMMLFGAGTTVNDFGNDLTSAVFLADQMRSMTDEVDFDFLLNYDNITYNGVDANGNTVAGLDTFQQHITVQPVNPEDMSVYMGPDPEAMLITADVSSGGNEVTRISWLRVR
ncbi:MAG: prepilin-type N-terminal cleavage/methylation domain-containing protein [Sedimentisphaerales bacterium]|nr:prepilin-type N-terminal cleavage/methylation domain-containing protein [Sedimentisphaerales bacterium]